MRRWVLAFGLLWAGCTARQRADVLWLPGRDYDFGEVGQGVPVRTTFRFRNNMRDSLRVEVIRTTCGCTSYEWSGEAVAPGDTGEVVLEYDAFRPGGFRKRAMVFFYGIRRPEYLVIRGEVE